MAPCLEGPSATRSATTLTRMILSRPTTVSRGKPVSGMPLIFMGSGFISIITGTLGSSQPLRLPTSGSVSTLPSFSAPSTTLCFQNQPASLRTSRRVENQVSKPVSAILICAMPTTKVQLNFLRGTEERSRDLSRKGSRRDAKSRQSEKSKEMRFRERRARRMTSAETKSRGTKSGRMQSQGKSRHVVNHRDRRLSLPGKTTLLASNVSHAEVFSIPMLSATNLTRPTLYRCKPVGLGKLA